MKSRLVAFLTAALLIVAGAARGETITVAAAISLKDAMGEIATLYKADTRDEIELTLGSSGQLMAQIRNGAPIDAFISAAAKQVDDLAKEQLTDDATRRIIAGNQLVLIVPAKATAVPKRIEDLADGTVYKKVAIGEPKTVPAGQYAEQVLKGLKLDSTIAERLIYGSNVRQVLDYVERGEVDAGLVYATDAKQSGDRVKVVAMAVESSHDPIVYPAVVLKGAKHSAAAKRFLDYLATDKARKVLESKGFTPAAPPKAAK